MLTKEQLQALKQTDTSQIYRLLAEAATTRDILFLLENLGHLPKAFNGKQTDKLLDWNMRQYNAEVIEASRVLGEYESSNVWRIDPTFDRVHSAVFPLELCNRVIRFYSYVGDLVFDPFGGSGTLGRAARDLDRHFFMVEKAPTYIERMREVFGAARFFDAQPVRFLSLEEFRD